MVHWNHSLFHSMIPRESSRHLRCPAVSNSSCFQGWTLESRGLAAAVCPCSASLWWSLTPRPISIPSSSYFLPLVQNPLETTCWWSSLPRCASANCDCSILGCLLTHTADSPVQSFHAGGQKAAGPGKGHHSCKILQHQTLISVTLRILLQPAFFFKGLFILKR